MKLSKLFYRHFSALNVNSILCGSCLAPTDYAGILCFRVTNLINEQPFFARDSFFHVLVSQQFEAVARLLQQNLSGMCVLNLR